MMKTFSDSFVSVAANTAGYATGVTLGAWTLSNTLLTGATGVGQLFNILNNSAVNHSAKTAVIVGLDAAGLPQTETMALPAASVSSTSAKWYSSVTSVTPSASITPDSMNLGWTASAVSHWSEPLNGAGTSPFNVGFCVTVDSGAPNYTAQHMYGTAAVFNHATVVTKTASFEGAYTSPVSRVRVANTVAGGFTLTLIASHR